MPPAGVVSANPFAVLAFAVVRLAGPMSVSKTPCSQFGPFSPHRHCSRRR
jgi:hypothetical protein